MRQKAFFQMTLGCYGRVQKAGTMNFIEGVQQFIVGNQGEIIQDSQGLECSVRLARATSQATLSGFFKIPQGAGSF